MLYSVMIAVCLSTVPLSDCNRHTSVSWTPAPEEQHGLSMCGLYGQEFAADANLAHDGEYVKVFCRPYTPEGTVG